jgi:hypothetical protein
MAVGDDTAVVEHAAEQVAAALCGTELIRCHTLDLSLDEFGQ